MKSKGRLLILDDNKDVLASLWVLLDGEFDEVITLSNPAQLMTLLRQKPIDVVLLDMNFTASVNSGNEGFFWLRTIREHDEAVVVVLFTAWGDVELAVKAMKEGATDFVLKPWDNLKLVATLRTAFQLSQSRQRSIQQAQATQELNPHVISGDFMNGISDAARRMMGMVDKAAPADVALLLTGENGTGKSILAHEIHRRSPRSNRCFEVVDLGSLSETLMESELFGHKKGAFTDAITDRKGRIEAAGGGTLFLDEIANLSLKAQAKLLHVLQLKQITPLGSNQCITVDFRLIAATNQNLDQLVASGAFREDLYYRIKMIEIQVPALRNRTDDILPFAEAFLQHYAGKYNKHQIQLSDAFRLALLRHPWPGNIRELQHVIERAVILSDQIIGADMLPAMPPVDTSREKHPLSLEEIEREAILAVLKKHGGNQVKAARELNITRQTIYNKIKKYGL